MICWMLYKVFPTEDEIRKHPLDRVNLEFIVDAKTLYFEKFMNPLGTSQNKNLQRMEESLIKKKIHLSNNLYKLIKFCCQNNEENQNYFLKFLGFYSNHIGHGVFVSAALEACLGSNEKILKNLSNYNANMLEAGEDPDSKKSKSFVTNILYKFKKFQRYEKCDILKLLSKFCSVDDENSIYKNQEIIFQALHKDEDLYYQVFMKIYSSNSLLDQKIYVELIGANKADKINAFSIEDILISEKKPISEKEIEYLKQQLILFSNLCLERNFTCIEYFGKLLPLKLLIKYTLTLNNEYSIQFRACFCQLIQNIYIDKEPRTILMMPNLVRKLELKKKSEKVQTFKNPFTMFRKRTDSAKKVLNENLESSPSITKEEKKQLLMIDSPAIALGKLFKVYIFY